MLSRVTNPPRVAPPAGRAEPLGLLVGLGIDALVADPRRAHPVAFYGRASARVQRRLEADSRAAGVAFWVASAGTVTGLGALLSRQTARSPTLRLAAVTAATWSVVGGTSLGREAARIASAVDAGDLPLARALLPNLVGRDPSHLDGPAMLRAVIESVAENTGDAALSPLLWGAALGLPGLLGFRAVNTLDAVVGHHSERYERFGWASARIDDVAGLLPARLGALFACLLAPVVGGSTSAARAAWVADAPGHPSPNAGPLEAAFAGALGLRLGGPVTYAYGESDRPWLNGAGRDPVPSDVSRAVLLSKVRDPRCRRCFCCPLDVSEHPVKGALLVAGTHSDAGKTVVTAGLCRWLARRGVDVAPFKAQNMSLNSFVTASGAEIGRAQAMQAAAAGIAPDALMNPVLLKPGSDTRSQVVVLGTPWTEIDAMGYRPLKARLREVALDSLATLRARHEVVICEGAGSPAEINLRRVTTSPTWGSPLPQTCRPSSSATSTGAGCSPRSSARLHCSPRRIRR